MCVSLTYYTIHLIEMFIIHLQITELSRIHRDKEKMPIGVPKVPFRLPGEEDAVWIDV